MRLMRSEPKSPYQKLATAKPSINEAAKINSAALMTSENSPSVRSVIGRVSSTKIGFRITLKTPRMRAAIRAV
jgi:hypothetical protein